MKLRAAAGALLLAALVPLLPVRAASFEVDPLRTTMVLAPGQAQTGAIEVRNTDRVRLRFQASYSDWYLLPDGTPRFTLPADLPRETAAWLRAHSLVRSIVVTPATLDLAPGERGYFRYTVVDPGGEPAFWGAIMIEALGDDLQPLGTGAELSLRQRYASLLYVNAPDARADVAVTAMTVAGADGVAILQADLVNRGTAVSRAVGTVTWQDAAGQEAAAPVAFDFPLLPDRIRRYALRLPDTLKHGPYTATLVFDFGGAELRGGRKQFQLPLPGRP